MKEPTIIHPVIMAVPEPDRRLKGRHKVTALRRIARKALYQSARYSGFTLGTLEKAENGAPLPSNGIYWSLTHKESYVAAVTAPQPIGIDIEKNRPFTEGLYRRLAEHPAPVLDRVAAHIQQHAATRTVHIPEPGHMRPIVLLGLLAVYYYFDYQAFWLEAYSDTGTTSSTSPACSSTWSPSRSSCGSPSASR